MWKVLSEKEGLLEKLPYRIGQRIEEEIAGNLIDNPEQSFSSVVHQTADFFRKQKNWRWIAMERDRPEDPSLDDPGRHALPLHPF